MIVYRLKQRTKTGVWTSPENFEARTTHEVKQAVIAGFIIGEERWAEDCRSDKVIFGMRANGVHYSGA